MNVKEFDIMESKIRKETMEGYERVKAKWERKEKIDIYMTQHKIESKSFESLSTPDEMVDAMREFMQRVNCLPFHQNHRMAIALSTMNYGYDGGSEVDDNHYEYTYSIFGDETYIEGIMKSKVKDAFELLLRPPGIKKESSVTCKLMELYLNETLDFKTLRELVYGKCGI